MAKALPGRMGRPRRAPDERPTRDRIFDAAIELFAARGYDGTSIRDIAGAVGVTEGAVYKHYPSKDAITDAVLKYFTAQVYQDLSAPDSAPGGASKPPNQAQMPVGAGARSSTRRGSSVPPSPSVFQLLLEGLPRFIASNPRMLKISRVILIEAYHNMKIKDYLRGQFGTRSQDLTESLLRKNQREGKMRQCDTRALAGLFNAFRFGWIYWTFFLDYTEPFNLERSEAELARMIRLLETLLSPAGGARRPVSHA